MSPHLTVGAVRDDVPSMADEVPRAEVVGATKVGEGGAPAAVVPYIPASKSLPELTVGVLILGAILAIHADGQVPAVAARWRMAPQRLARGLARGLVLCRA